MANIPRKLSSPEHLKASWLNQLIDYVISITPRGDGKTISVSRTPGGSTISKIGAKGGGVSGSGLKTSPVQLKSKTDYQTYIGDIFGNGYAKAATETNKTIKINSISPGETIPNLNTSSTRFLAAQIVYEANTYYTIDIPRWL